MRLVRLHLLFVIVCSALLCHPTIQQAAAQRRQLNPAPRSPQSRSVRRTLPSQTTPASPNRTATATAAPSSQPAAQTPVLEKAERQNLCGKRRGHVESAAVLVEIDEGKLPLVRKARRVEREQQIAVFGMGIVIPSQAVIAKRQCRDKRDDDKGNKSRSIGEQVRRSPAGCFTRISRGAVLCDWPTCLLRLKVLRRNPNSPNDRGTP